MPDNFMIECVSTALHMLLSMKIESLGKGSSEDSSCVFTFTLACLFDWIFSIAPAIRSNSIYLHNAMAQIKKPFESIVRTEYIMWYCSKKYENSGANNFHIPLPPIAVPE